MADPQPTPRTNWDTEPSPGMPTLPARLRVGLPRYTEFDVALRRIREMLTIIILAFIVVAIVVVIVGAWTTLEALSNGGAGVEVPLPTPSG